MGGVMQLAAEVAPGLRQPRLAAIAASGITGEITVGTTSGG
jgi:hypothetical protein